MGCMLDKPICSKTGDAGDGNGLRWGVASMQGWRCEMEDTHAVRSGLLTATAAGSTTETPDFSDWSFFAVFDGHAGDQSAAYSSQHLLDAIVATDAFRQRNIVEGIRSGFLTMDDALREQFATLHSTMDNSGSTAIAAFVSPDHVYLANCGDSRAVLCRNGAPAFSTQDHKPVLPGERERIMNAGGSVIIQRVNGSLAVSRALGDFEYKNVQGKGQCEQLVSPEPEVFCVDREADGDQFMVLACDGIWDVMSNEEVCSFVAARLRVTADLRAITYAVIDTCFHKVRTGGAVRMCVWWMLCPMSRTLMMVDGGCVCVCVSIVFSVRREAATT